VIGFDTNVLVRILVGDDPGQTKKAERAFVAHTGSGGVFVSLIVLAELSWVLSAAYEWNRAMIHDRISQLIRTRGVVTESLELVMLALEEFKMGRADLADYLIVGRAQEFGARAGLLTFDKKLARAKGVSLV
jgi:predicted nucleic-acid-binding protein